MLINVKEKRSKILVICIIFTENQLRVIIEEKRKKQNSVQ